MTVTMIEIAVGDTTLGRMQKRKKKEAHQSIINMADDELTEALAARAMVHKFLEENTTQDGAEGTV